MSETPYTPVGDSKKLASAMVDWASRDRIGLSRNVRRSWFEETMTYDAIGRDLMKAYANLVEKAGVGNPT